MLKPGWRDRLGTYLAKRAEERHKEWAEERQLGNTQIPLPMDEEVEQTADVCGFLSKELARVGDLSYPVTTLEDLLSVAAEHINEFHNY